MESNNNQEYFGYFKYQGSSVEDGYIDARKSSEAF
jgi:hypothetical protein